MPTMKGACCRECVFWEPSSAGDDSATGECRRHAPTAFVPLMVPHHPERYDDDGDQYETNADWPRTGETDWCGEFIQEDTEGGA